MKKGYSKLDVISDGHWRSESYCQRITTGDWKRVLLNNDDRITFEGRVRKLIAKSMGCGVVEISKEPRNV